MKRLCLLSCLAALWAWILVPQSGAQTCSIGGHDETSENLAPGGWATIPQSPGAVAGAPAASHLVFSEVAPRGFGTGAGSDSSEYVEIYNPTARPVRLDNKYVSDDIGYYRIVNGPYPAANNSDWAGRFPQGLVLNPGRTLVLCVTKAGFAASGGFVAAAAQYFLEMRDSNGNPADDMTVITTGSIFPLSGGMLTNPSATNGEWIVLFCWDGASDLVCDIDYASWGANSATNPKMNKTGIAIDGPDAGAIASAYNPDTAAGAQTNLGAGTVLAKPNTYQRVGGEVGEVALGGNGCVGLVAPVVIAWAPVAGTANIRFHTRWMNQDEDASSTPINGQMSSQEFGVFLDDYGPIGSFNIPEIPPDSFFDVFIEIPLSQLPPPPPKMLPGGAPAVSDLNPLDGGVELANACPPDTNWAGNVDIFWSGSGQGGQVGKHYTDLITCIGGPPSYVHFRFSNCTSPMPWSVVGLCPGFSSTLVNEDFTPAPNPVPVGWTGWICVSADPTVPKGASCCFGVEFQCNGQTATIELCSTACDWEPNNPPVLTTVDWTTIGSIVRFHQQWVNQSSSSMSDPVNGDMNSQMFGVFQPNFGPIGPFSVPPLPPDSFFDVFLDIPLSQLPPPPEKMLPGGGAPSPGLDPRGDGAEVATDCPPDTNWAGNVDIIWNGPGGGGQVNKHYADLLTCRGGPPSYIHFAFSNCPSPMPWSVVGLCPGFSATLVNEDFTPAPNPVPVGWTGWICVSAAAAVPSGASCCFGITFQCDNATSTIDICSTACNWQNRPPTLTAVDWSPVGPNIRFHQRWENMDPSGPSDPVSGDMSSQMFGVFQPNFGPIGSFMVPPIPPDSFFDVFLEVPLSSLPLAPQKILPGGGPAPTVVAPASEGGPTLASDCPPDTNWAGNVDIFWSGPGGGGQVNRHYADLLTCAGGPPSYIHFAFSNCPSPMPWSVVGVCPGYSVTLVNEDFTPAPNPVPVGWTGWICVSTAAAVPSGTSCCFGVVFQCDNATSTIDICSTACDWQPRPPTLSAVTWTNIDPATVRFHQRWSNPDPSGPSDPVNGNMSSQMFGVFLPNFGPIGSFSVPPIQPSSFFDVFIDIPLSRLPPPPQQQLPGGGPQPGSPCPPPSTWHGNVDVVWDGNGGPGQTNKHFGELLVCPGADPSYLHVITGCPNPTLQWTINGVCAGFNATLVNEDYTPAPNPLPPGWTGWLCVSTPASTPTGTTCCFTIDFLCDGAPGTIDVCAITCNWSTSATPPPGLAFGIYLASPNPTNRGMSVGYVLPESGPARLDVYNVAGQLARALFDGPAEAGTNVVLWDGRGENGRRLAPGTYFITLRAGAREDSRKILIR